MKNILAFFRGRRMRLATALTAVWSVLAPSAAFALPQGGSVRSGSVSWETADGTMTLRQTSNRAIINWNSFGIGGDETVRFIQPGANAAVLNRVTGPYSSEIFGTLLANGNVYLVNPNGILFGAGARVDVGGLVASTFDISNRDFMAGRLNFERVAGAAKVSNHGNITASSLAYLIGGSVENNGSITAPAAVLAAGRSQIVIDRTEDGNEIRLRVDPGMEPFLFDNLDNPADMPNVVNSGSVNASGATGGEVFLQGVNVVQDGTIRADGTEGNGGSVKLHGERLVALSGDSVTTADAGRNGDGGRVEIIAEDYAGVYAGATIAARGGSESGDGGFVETSGHKNFFIDSAPDVGAANGAAGEWLIDPYNITIVDAGDMFMSGVQDLWAVNNNAQLSVATIRSGLTTGNVTINTGTSGGTQEGNIYVNADISYQDRPSRTLTLDAANDIHLNKNIVAGADNTLGLIAGGGVIQDAGARVEVGTVDFNVAGGVAMQSAGNKIGTLTGVVGGNLGLVNNANLDLDNLRVETGATTLNVAGNLTDTRGNVLSDLTVTASGDILLDGENDFGEVTAKASNGAGRIVLNDVNGIVLRDMDGGSLKVGANAGDITQKDGTRV